jgi:hypothetical protein
MGTTSPRCQPKSWAASAVVTNSSWRPGEAMRPRVTVTLSWLKNSPVRPAMGSTWPSARAVGMTGWPLRERGKALSVNREVATLATPGSRDNLALMSGPSSMLRLSSEGLVLVRNVVYDDAVRRAAAKAPKPAPAHQADYQHQAEVGRPAVTGCRTEAVPSKT